MWTYKGKTISSLDDFPEGTHSFIYIMTDPLGKAYIGKKQLLHINRVKTTKKDRLLNARKKTKIVSKESIWLNYYGSSKLFSEAVNYFGKENIKREILEFCRSKKHASYKEVYYQMVYRVLEFPEKFYNSCVFLSRTWNKDV